MNNQKPKYLLQWKRVLRWFDRIREFENGVVIPQDRAEDEIRAFFIECYNFKGWLESDFPRFKGKGGMYQLFDKKTGNIPLRICMDLADRAKHHDLTGSKQFRRDPETDTDKKKDVTIIMKAPLSMNNEQNKSLRPQVICTFYVTSANKDFEALNLAKDCVDGWKEFLNKHNIELL